MNALCISPGCSKEALSIDGGWIACEEHERHHEPLPMVSDPTVEQYIEAMYARRLAEHWELQERPAWIPTRKANPWDPPNENRRRTDG